MSQLKELKIAIVCDWLTGIGGAELVVLEFHRLFPDAPIYTSQYDSTKIDWFKDADIRTTWLQKLPKSLKKFLPLLRAFAFSRLNLSKYDLVISISGAEAKAVKTGPNTIHLNYCNAPTHYYWFRYDEYLKHPGFGAFDWLARIGLKLLVGPMRRWDFKAAQKPNYLIANSTFTQENIKKYYKRDSEVIYPPVDVNRFNSDLNDQRKGFVIAGRQTPYKFIDLAVRACTKLKLELIVIGSGPEHNNLISIAGPSIKFRTNVGYQQIPKYFQSAVAFIFPGMDDFGIVAVEALAAGTPVIAYKKGGALDYIDSNNGLFFDEQSVESLCDAFENFNETEFSHEKISQSSQIFSESNFKNKIIDLINKLVD